MIRPLTLITMLLAAGSGAYLFAVKHHAQMLDDQIAGFSQGARLDAQRIRVLQAQWALETDPTRLQQLAAQFTDLQPMQPAQLVTLAALKSSLPAPGSAPPAGNPELPNQAQPNLGQAELDASAAPSAAAALPLPPPPPPAMMATAQFFPAPLSGRRGRRLNHSVLGGTQFAAALPPPRPYRVQNQFSAPERQLAPVGAQIPGAPVGAQIMPVKATASVPEYAASPPPYAAGSALGLAANLPPPQPLSGINN